MKKSCSDCRLVFGLVDSHADFPGTCTDCVSRLRGPCKQCDVCERAVAANEFIWKGDWQVRCVECTREELQDQFYDLRPDDDAEDAIEWAVISDLERRLTPVPTLRKEIDFALQVLAKWMQIRSRRRLGLPVVGS